MDPHFYNVNIKWSGDRKGTMSSPELKAFSPENGNIEVATPPEFPKGIPGIWSPEHLFTAAVSSCFMTTFLAVAEHSKLEFKDFSCKSSGKLASVDKKLAMTEVHIEPTVTIVNEEDRDRAIRVMQKAESLCLITNSITAKVILNPVVECENCVSSL